MKMIGIASLLLVALVSPARADDAHHSADGVVRQVDDIVNEECFERLREMGFLPKKPRDTDLAPRTR